MESHPKDLVVPIGINMDDKSESLSTYQPDIAFLYTLRDFMTTDIRSSDDVSAFPPEGKFSKLNNGRDVRSVYPQGPCVLRDVIQQISTLYFVGFIGFKQANVDEALVKKIWQLDSQIMKALRQFPDILAYVTGEREDGEWGNLVILRTVDVIETWKNSAIHTSAMTEISPKYYHTVRIHRGQMESGINGDLRVTRTLFLDYENEDIRRREVKVWD